MVLKPFFSLKLLSTAFGGGLGVLERQNWALVPILPLKLPPFIKKEIRVLM
ncbi:MAG: hypothetical protein ACI9XO_002534 [Paraglaciecola sp.]|jgi:hypothetical protein